jgi:hypothetical protein
VTQDAVQGGLNLVTSYGYDEVGNRVSQTDANQHTTRNFRRKIELLKILKATSEYRRGGQRPARLYRFAAARFEKLKDKGILFPF